MSTGYTDAYFGTFISGSAQSAEAVLPHVLDLVRPGTAIDVGCGTGVWTKALLDRGVDAIGIDAHVTEETLAIPRERFARRDLTQGTGVERRFDLALSLEVVEHLPPIAGQRFIGELARLAPVVLFGGAVPYQGGRQHLNERPASYWVEQFARHGFAPFDVIRPKVWGDPAVEPWYKQNCLLYVQEGHVERLGLTDDDRPQLIDVIHPELFATRLGRPGLRDVAKMFPGAVRRRLRRLRRDVTQAASGLPQP